MRLSPTPPTIGDNDGFSQENDLFELRAFGERLASLVRRINEPLVIAVDGPWGSGKSTFVRQWAGLLRQQATPVILFDAFANDHQEDAFIPLASEIASLARAASGQKGPAITFADKAKKAGRVLMPFAGRVAVRAASLGLVSAEDVEGAQEFIKGMGADASKLTEQVIEERLQKVETDRATLDAFRQSLRDLAGQLGSNSATEESNGAHRPLIVIVDELDRCRPPFALNLLERMKHLFSVGSVCFVIVSNVSQLAATIRGSYGSDFDAWTYLEKFYQIRIELPATGHDLDKDRAVRYISYLWNAMELESGDPSHDHSMQEGLRMLAKVYNLPLRSLERVAAYIALYQAAADKGLFREPCLVVGLCVMKHISPDLFAKARSGALVWREAKDFLRLDEWVGGSLHDWYQRWWKFVTSAELSDQDMSMINNAIFRYNIGDNTLSFMCSVIDNLDIPNK